MKWHHKWKFCILVFTFLNSIIKYLNFYALKLGVRDLFSFVHIFFSFLLFFFVWGDHSTIAAIYSFDGYFDSICFFCIISIKQIVIRFFPFFYQWINEHVFTLLFSYWKCIDFALNHEKNVSRSQTKMPLNCVTSLCFNLKQTTKKKSSTKLCYFNFIK